jgi:hypothetical protein
VTLQGLPSRAYRPPSSRHRDARRCASGVPVSDWTLVPGLWSVVLPRTYAGLATRSVRGTTGSVPLDRSAGVQSLESTLT